MASSILSEDQFLCPICLGMLTQPVSTPCGHNFCIGCITTYWNSAPVCRCPVCKETFERRPHLKVNTFISELASQFMLLQVTDAHICSMDRQQANSGSKVLCDICTDTQQEAVRSCLECLTSYCSVHLEPHHRAAGLKRHTLVNPMANLEHRICKYHNRLLVLFCGEDKALLCDACSGLCHVNHNVVPVPQAYDEMKDLLRDTEAKVQQMILERHQKVQLVSQSVKEGKRESETMIAMSMRDLTALVAEIQTSQAKLVNVMEEMQKASEEQAQSFICGVEQEIADLQRTRKKLRELSQTRDQFCFLQDFSTTCVLPQTTDLSSFSFHRQGKLRHLRTSVSSSVSQLHVLLNKINTEMSKISAGADAACEATLAAVQHHEVNVVLNPFTAHPILVLSDDMKEVRYSLGLVRRGPLNPKPEMFTDHLAVLGNRGFLSCKFYFEVFVGQKCEWCLGVARESVQRRGMFTRSRHSGLWALWFQGDKFESFCSPDVPVHWGKVERVGVFVDYDGGQVSFYDVHTAALIHSFTGCDFTEKLYPYFNPCDNEYGSNLGPMRIVPVVHMNS